ncbi:SLAP domain-containing protein [Gracilibacillus sp. YIM 98692]|uniref:SLAP domain-containing protein n=1 Tax=Gracilibacillus sp. YIM 98692 TaxID=2663532 RepID=UPI0013D51C6F|nr:SLAP domain-containing protein [Gracilibacillus sp. YIM 98692]
MFKSVIDINNKNEMIKIKEFGNITYITFQNERILYDVRSSNITSEFVENVYDLGLIDFENNMYSKAVTNDDELRSFFDNTEKKLSTDQIRKYKEYIDDKLKVPKGQTRISVFDVTLNKNGGLDVVLLSVNKSKKCLVIPTLPIKIVDNNNNKIVWELFNVNIKTKVNKISYHKLVIDNQNTKFADIDLSEWKATFEKPLDKSLAI